MLLCKALDLNHDRLWQTEASVNVNKGNRCPIFSLLYSLKILYAVFYLQSWCVCTSCCVVLCDTGGLGVNKVQFSGVHILENGACHEPLRTFMMYLPR